MGRNKWTDCVGTSGRVEWNRQRGIVKLALPGPKPHPKGFKMVDHYRGVDS
jgi:hypothetical protein